jgi:hypothetical protein
MDNRVENKHRQHTAFLGKSGISRHATRWVNRRRIVKLKLVPSSDREAE